MFSLPGTYFRQDLDLKQVVHNFSHMCLCH